MDEKEIKQSTKHSRWFYFSIVGFLIIAFIVFSILTNTFSKAKTVEMPLAFPMMLIIIFYEGVIKENLSEVGIKKENFLRNIGIGILLAFGFCVIFALIKLIVPDFTDVINSGLDATTTNFFILNFLFPLNYVFQTIYAFVFLAPAEEILFRGFIQGKLQERTNVYWAIIIQSFLFGLAHAVPAYATGLSPFFSLSSGLIGFFGGVALGNSF